ncbi:DUF3107 domain-containing protein [Corynebacterium spheniscorum]|uniref:ATP-binding protein n=1 Tax=Corynebacterium spheniscorum TaxID=185761 RepID=A0A1I2PWF2_9CORY|nr:DUF3107 domain-containing protein [Corynebacterium spheniscorum]KAA8723480.1 DUF3107 domain-containing protein [Corynebacterium spheniscorum]SFG20472.1 Protein of unknown function [Corynebacterium spheniscorum]
MEIKIGFVDSPRELSITMEGSQEDLAGRIHDALSQTQGTLDLQDTKGHRFIIRNERIAYVELGKGQARPVGFAGI